MTAIRSVVAVLIVAALGALAFTWLWPAYLDMPRRRQVAEVILGAAAARKEIDYRVRETKTLAGAGRGLGIVPQGAVTGGEVSADGVIIVRGTVDGYPIEVGMKPTLKPDGEVEWRCRGLKVMEGRFVPEGAYLPQPCPKASAQNPF
jgi:hypothetical protein